MTAGAAPLWIRIPRFAFAVLGILALVWIPIRNIGESGFWVDNFSYFTIESNVLGVIVLLIGAIRDPRSAIFATPATAAPLYLIVTAIVYAVLQSHICLGNEQGWVDDVLQRIMPMVMIVDWVPAPVALGISGRLIAGGWSTRSATARTPSFVGRSSTGIRTCSSIHGIRAVCRWRWAWWSWSSDSRYSPSRWPRSVRCAAAGAARTSRGATK